MDKTATTALYERAGLEKKVIENLLKNEPLCKTLTNLLVSTDAKDLSKVGYLLFSLASKCKIDGHRDFIAKYIGTGKIITAFQLDEAIAFFKNYRIEDKVDGDVSGFETACGVGVVVTTEQIKTAASDVVAEFIKAGKKLALGDVIVAVKRVGNVKFGDGAVIKKAIDEELAKAPKIDTKVEKKVEKVVEKVEIKPKEEHGVSNKFETSRVIEDAKNPPEIMEAHLKFTGGKPITRFPPEPNGFLHIGHAKAMNLSFKVSREGGGYTILRYDDTNPEVEEDLYYKSIKEMVEWMGFKPAKITYTSDYFPQMYELACQLIKSGLAYCDPSTTTEMAEQREAKVDSPYREKYTPEENLKIFDDMRKGVYEEGKMALRCKMYNPYLRDFVCYRIKYHKHPQTGDKWCIYPSYDFSHCIVDSLENITHSLCTLEFETRRDSYYWLLKVLNLYRPHVWEFSRLNITKNVMSKRRLLELVNKKMVNGWDDPRMFTLAGMRRRGYTPEAIRAFCDVVGVTRVENMITFERLEQSVRDDLDERADRVFAILNPLKVTLTHLEAESEIEGAVHPKYKERGSRKLKITKTLYIDHDDFREVDSKDFYGLAPNKEVGLRYGPNILCTEVVKNGDKIVELKCTADFSKKTKTKGHIHWLSTSTAVPCEVRLYKPLFTVDNIGDESNWEQFLDPTSEEILKGCFAEKVFEEDKNRKGFSHYQFERVGFFAVDPDTTKDRLVFNRIVTLKESSTKTK